jgi:outer membrane protein TolC
VKRAVAERPEVEALRARVRSMEANAQSARAATKPQAGLQAGYDYANPNPKILPLTGDWNDTWSIGLNLSWKVFDGGKSNAASARATAQADSLRAQLSDLESRIRLEVVTRRLELESAIAGKVVAARGVDAARDALRVAQDRYKEGVLVSSELLDAETRLLTAQLEITRNEAQIQVARANLTRAVGR